MVYCPVQVGGAFNKLVEILKCIVQCNVVEVSRDKNQGLRVLGLQPRHNGVNDVTWCVCMSLRRNVNNNGDGVGELLQHEIWPETNR